MWVCGVVVVSWARLTMPASCTGILALPGARDHLATAREFASSFFLSFFFFCIVCVRVNVFLVLTDVRFQNILIGPHVC